MTEKPIKHPNIPVIGFVGYSGSGKTTLVSRIIRRLRELGVRPAVVKHAHHLFDIDTPGKDSYILRQAGALQTIVASKFRWALMVETPDAAQEPELADLLQSLDPNTVDVVLVEGFKHAAYRKMEIHRSELNKPLLHPHDPDIIAFVTDQPATTENPREIPILDLNDTEQIVQFVVRTIGIDND
jgi:molybdopterin-guanine dinucleotide biosynthesis protein B